MILWNRHSNRTQSKRSHVVPGKPIKNFFWPAAGYPRFERPADKSIWEGLEEDFSEWGMHPRNLLPLFSLTAISEVLARCADIDEYIPKSTLDSIEMQLANHGSDQPDIRGGAFLDNGSRLHVHAYTQLEISLVCIWTVTSCLLPGLRQSF